jgi:exodeoxyribonuclease V gamma subunit
LLIDQLFDERGLATLLLLSKTCAAVHLKQGDTSGVERPIELALIRQQLTTAVERGSAASGFLTSAR